MLAELLRKLKKAHKVWKYELVLFSDKWAQALESEPELEPEPVLALSDCAES